MRTNLLWDSGKDETVQVDQRGLIDKILSRYPGEFTVFRELLQNSDDAKSQKVEISFETKEYYVDAETTQTVASLDNTTIHQWIFKNDGHMFCEEDWHRLKKIGEGNPDEEKIGAFGVGFYSLFSITEEPLVSSGGKWMGFYWKNGKNQLVARSGSEIQHSRGDQSQSIPRWTTFTMPLRDPHPMPSVADLIQFLASSIIFMKHIREINIHFNDYRLATVKKMDDKPKYLPMPDGRKPFSPQKMMEITNIGVSTVKIQVAVMNSVCSSQSLRPEKSISKASKSNLISLTREIGRSAVTHTPLPESPPARAMTQTDISLLIFWAAIRVELSEKMTLELERSTRKKPPSQLKVELIYTSKDQYDSSLSKGSEPEIIFQALRADLNKGGNARVFIGHSTSQSTGIGGHISARLIPTVERECIDFGNSYVATWNREILYVGGILARATYDYELKQLREQWDSCASIRQSDNRHSRFVGNALHTLKFFDFYDSQPSREVSAQLQNAFFSCSTKENFQMISTTGIKLSRDIRLPNAYLIDTLKDVPTLPVEVMEANLSIVTQLKDAGIFKEISFQDVISELQCRTLTDGACTAFLKWWITTQGQRPRSCDQLTQFLSVIRIAIPDQDDLPLNSVQYFFNRHSPATASIPVDGPLPRSLLPLSISDHFSPEEISAHFPWVKFDWCAWLIHIGDNDDETYNLRFSASSEKVISAVSSVWDRQSDESKLGIKDFLRDKTCIPTSQGMKKPVGTYFPSADVLPGLPIIKFSSNIGPLEALLQDLGVHSHVGLQVILDRIGEEDDWPVTMLVGYLASIKGISPEEISSLREIPAFRKEMSFGEAECKTEPKYRAQELYPPLEEFRAMGLPILDWGREEKWWHEMDEAIFLYKIGLQRHPSMRQLKELCSSRDEQVRVAAFQYLLDQLDEEYPLDDIPGQLGCIIPAFNGSECCLASVEEVYSNPAWTSIGLLVLQPTYRPYADKLKIAEHPTSGTLISLLQAKPPHDTSEAIRWFTLLATTLNVFSQSDLKWLSTTSFIPITTDEGRHIQWQSPSCCCFLGLNVGNTFYEGIFTFVDFGPGANAFLSACGSKNQPSIEDVAIKLVENPHYFYEILGSSSNYLAELRKLALDRKNLIPETIQRMKDSPILLGVKKIPGNVDKSTSVEWEEEEVIYRLAKPCEIAIVDDMNTYRAFSDVAIVAPQEDILEEFYHSLGCQKLSTLIHEQRRSMVKIEHLTVGQDIRALILERLPFFLRDHKHKVMKNTLSEDNFAVATYSGLQVRKHLTLGGVNARTEHDVSALSFQDHSGRIVLWITPDAKDNMLEVATSLNRLIFEFPKTNDAVLFMTILESDLNRLKLLGYNVDHILAQKASQLQKESDLMSFSDSDSYRPVETLFDFHTQLPSSDWENYFSNFLLPAIFEFNSVDIDMLENHDEHTNPEVDGYCNLTGSEDALHLMGTIDSVQIYLSDESPYKKTGEFIYLKQEKIKSLQIFYNNDIRRPVTAINRDGRIYLNLRYFEAWHDQSANKVNIKGAHFMWYFAIVHVLSHNVARSHGAWHDRVFSSICQKYMPELTKLGSWWL